MNRMVRAALAVVLAAMAVTLVSGQTALANDPVYGLITFQKVDQDGNLLGGAKIDGWSCARWGNDPQWKCQSLNEYSWFDSSAWQPPPADWDEVEDGPYPDPPTNSLDLTGLADQFSEDISLRGSWSSPIQHCVVLEEKAAPAGYQLRPGRSLFCAGKGGWTEANAAQIDVGLMNGAANNGPWTVENVLSSHGRPYSTTFTLMNTKPVTFDKVDLSGQHLAGGQFRASSCTWWDQPVTPIADPEYSSYYDTPLFDDGYDQWQCAPLDAASTPGFAADLPNTGSSGLIDTGAPRPGSVDLLPRPGMHSVTALYQSLDSKPDGLILGSVPDKHCIVVQETSAPDRYIANQGTSVFCRANNSWIAIDDPSLALPAFKNEAPIKATKGPWVVTEVRDGQQDLVSTRFSLANEPKGRVAIPVGLAITDACNPAGGASNVAWTDPLPASTSLLIWSEDAQAGTRTVALADPTVFIWETGSSSPIVFTLPTDARIGCGSASTVTSPAVTSTSLTPPAFMPSGRTLPATGSDVTGMLSVAFGLLFAGALAVAVTRRRRPA